MADGLYDGSLESIPGLGGYLQQTRLNNAQTGQNLQNSAAAMQLIQAQKAQQDDANVRQVLSQGGEPGMVMQSLMKLGSPTAISMASNVMKVNQAMATQQALQGINFTNADPDKLRSAALSLSPTNPAAATALTSMADKMEGRQAAQGEHAAQVSQVTPITETPTLGVQSVDGVNRGLSERSTIAPGGPMAPAGSMMGGNQQATEPVPPEVLAAAASGRPFSIGVGPSANPAENTQRTGGLFSQFYNSPISVLQNAAVGQQTALDNSNPLAVPPKSWDDKVAAMGAREGSLAQAQASLAQSGALGQARLDMTGRGQDMRQQNIMLQAGLNPDGTLTPGGEAAAQLIAANKMPAPSGTALARLGGQTLMARVSQINPNFSFVTAPASLANEKNMSAGKMGATVRSLSVATDHLGTLSELAGALQNGDIQLVNKIGNYFAAQTGGVAPTNFNAAKAIVSDEIVKAVLGSSGALGDRATADQTLNAANSPEQLKGVIDTYMQLMSGQLRGVHQQYVANGGTKDFNSFLSDQAQNAAAAHPPSGGPQSSGLQLKLPDGTVATFKSGAQLQAFKAANGMQ